MDGVSAVRAYTVLAVLAIVAGGWMLNEAPEADLIEPEMDTFAEIEACLLYTSPSPRDVEESRMPSSA